jgi:predicted metal-binding protein
MSKRQIRKIRLTVNAENINKDLEKYCRKAKKKGATDAKTINAEMIPIDERVSLKCRIPICFGYGTSANCPPYTIKPSEFREIVEKYKYALVFKIEVEPKIIVRKRETILERVDAYMKIFDLVNKIESMAFYDGYYFALGLAAGSCKSTFCHNVECANLKGERCRNELRVRPSMEAVGIDAYKLATTVGWEIFPIGSSCEPEDIPKGTLMGLVLVC